MGICTQCGTLMHNDDIQTHVCKPQNIPLKGKPIVLQGTPQ